MSNGFYDGPIPVAAAADEIGGQRRQISALDERIESAIRWHEFQLPYWRGRDNSAQGWLRRMTYAVHNGKPHPGFYAPVEVERQWLPPVGRAGSDETVTYIVTAYIAQQGKANKVFKLWLAETEKLSKACACLLVRQSETLKP